MKREMRGLLHRTERNQANVIRMAHFFKRPANAAVARQSFAAIGRPFSKATMVGSLEGFSFSLLVADDKRPLLIAERTAA
jgi:hypothetical protein